MLLYIIAILEWFSTLAVQIIALRAATPIVGSSIIMTSIYIGIILLALSIGYYVWWVLAEKLSREKIVARLVWSLSISGVYYLILTFWAHQYLLEHFLAASGAYVRTLFIVAFILFFVPVTLAAQTIPLLTELLPITSKGKSTGVMLFASTVWSFLWSVGTSLVLFQTLWVTSSSVITAAIVLLAAGLTYSYLNKHKAVIYCTLVICCTLFYLLLFHNPRGGHIYKFDSAYQEIIIKKISIEWEDSKLFMINKAFASAIIDAAKKSPFGYIREAITITEESKPKTVLVIGSAGFTYPYEAAQIEWVERIDTVDIDPSLQKIAEEYFLEDTLPNNVSVYAQPARHFVNQAIKQERTYDMIFIDAYNGKTIPEQLLTVEFYQKLKLISSNGNIVMNMISDKSLESDFFRRGAATIHAGFNEKLYAKDVSYSEEWKIGNIILATKKWDEDYVSPTLLWPVYTDNMRTTEFDHFRLNKLGLH